MLVNKLVELRAYHHADILDLHKRTIDILEEFRLSGSIAA